jgi:hypothetical protein
MPVIHLYYANPVTEDENTMLIPVDSIVKVEKLTEEYCLLTLSTQREKILVLETLAEVLEKIEESNNLAPIAEQLKKIGTNMVSPY